MARTRRWLHGRPRRVAGQAPAGDRSGSRLPRAVLLFITLVLLAACTEEGPTFLEPSSSSRRTTPVPAQTSDGPVGTTTPTSTSSAVAPSDAPGPTSPAVSSSTSAAVAFLSLRFDCTYVPDSFQDKWTRARAGEDGFGQPGPTQRYSFGHVGGRALMLLPSAFDTGILDRDRLRIKAEAPGPGRLTLWVTKPNPDPGLTYEGVAAVLEPQLAAVMSTTEPPAEGSCTASPTDALPPMSATTPDDTTDAPRATSP